MAGKSQSLLLVVFSILRMLSISLVYIFIYQLQIVPLIHIPNSTSNRAMDLGLYQIQPSFLLDHGFHKMAILEAFHVTYQPLKIKRQNIDTLDSLLKLMNWSHLMCMSTWMGQVEYPKSNLPYGWRCTLNKWLIRRTRYQIPSTLDFGSWIVLYHFTM